MQLVVEPARERFVGVAVADGVGVKLDGFANQGARGDQLDTCRSAVMLFASMETKLLTGIVQSGEPGSANVKPLPSVPVTVYEATAQDPLPVGTATTDAEGRFELHMESDKSERIFYATATVREGVELVTIIGPALHDNKPAWITASPPDAASRADAKTPSNTAAESDEHSPGNTASITINELTTVAAAFAMAQFIQNNGIGGDAFGLQIASLMNDNLASPRSGASSEVLLTPPNADESNSLRSTRSLANLIAACVQNVPNAVTNLFTLTIPPYGGSAPTSTFQALVNIARYPANNVADIYTQSQALEAYSPPLESKPDAWTLAVKVNDTGLDKFLFAGPGNIAFDNRGYAWISNNVIQGTPNSSRFAVVLKPNGKPADGTPATPSEGPASLPKSPLFGGGLVGGGFGVAIDKHGLIWFGNFGWGEPEYYPVDGGVSVFNPAGDPQSPDLAGYVGGTFRVQAVVSDEQNNIWNASFGNGRVVVFLEGDPQRTLWAQVPDGGLPFGIALAADGSAWVTSSTGLWAYTSSSVSQYKIDQEKGQLELQFFKKFGHALKGLSIDSMGNIWIPSGGDDVVYVLDSEGYEIGKFAGGGINGPWGTAVDGDDNIWVANFGKMLPTADYTNAAVSKLAGANADTRPPGFAMGEAITPPRGYTLPTAGAPVRLHNGELLYGKDSEKCYCPLMRMTNVVIDQAGNVWAVNNWKPSFDTDASPETGNPGGDGIVIFVGLAKPPRRT